MSDFFQTGAIATLHRLGPPGMPRLERELQEFVVETPIALVLPCHIRELGTRALKLIARELKNVSYIKQIVVGIDGANMRSWKKARTFLRNCRKNRFCCGTTVLEFNSYTQSWKMLN